MILGLNLPRINVKYNQTVTNLINNTERILL